MESLLWAVPLLPAAGFAILAIASPLFKGKAAGILASAAAGLSFAASLLVAIGFLSRYGIAGSFVSGLGAWIDSGGMRVAFGLRIDAIAVVMMLVVAFVAFLIHLYSIESMAGEERYTPFFAYLNLFVASMLILVLADNLLLLFMGWEGVGVCSYLLIGFWYKGPSNVQAANKAFIVTRIGDAAMALGLFLLFVDLGTFDIAQVQEKARSSWEPGSGIATAAALLLLAGAVGKSGQVPLHVWLPDAMAGPTPVSALIHAATMVTAGVYLVARLHVLFALSPAAMFVTAVVGAATLVYGALGALTQTDIKKILAYSTISQIGYMFLANGLGAWDAALFHFMTHAFFKALLFLAAGIVIDAMREEHDIFRMGGLRERLPVAYWTTLIGAASLSSIPLVTAGFFSKDAIITASLDAPGGGAGFFVCALLGSLLTAIYAFRLVFVVFYGQPLSEAAREIHRRPGRLMVAAVAVLSFFAIVSGWIGIPPALGGHYPFGAFLHPEEAGGESLASARIAIILSSTLVVIGIFLAYVYAWRRYIVLTGGEYEEIWIETFLVRGLGFDWVYERVFVRPFVYLTSRNRRDFMDGAFTLLKNAVAASSRLASTTETGRVRGYAAGLLIGAILAAGLLIGRWAR